MLKGKARYLSPEQASGLPLDGRSDLFATGVMLYEMLTGQSPFSGASIPEIIAQVLHRPVPPPRDLRPEVPEDLSEITMRLLERARDQRYPSGREAASALLVSVSAQPGGPDAVDPGPGPGPEQEPPGI